MPRVLQRRFDDQSAIIGIAGLGYVGLPLALTFAEKGFRVLGFDVDVAKVEALNAGRNYIQHLDGTRLSRRHRRAALRGHRRLRPARRARRSDHLRADPADAPARARHELRREHGPADPGPPAARASSWCSSPRPTRARPTSSCEADPRAVGLCMRPRLLPGLLAGTRRPRQRKVQHGDDPEDRRGRRRDGGRPRREPLRQGRRADGPRRKRPRGRGGQARREHLSRRQHRPRQRAQDRLRPHGHRHLERARRRIDEALRIHALQSGTRLGRPLHSARPLLPLLEGPRVRRDAEVHRARRRGQRADAGVRDREAQRWPSTSAARRRGAAGSSFSASPTRRTSTTPGRARPSRSSRPSWSWAPR